MAAIRVNDRIKRLIPLVFALVAMFASYMFAQQYIKEQLAAKDRELQEKLERVYQDYPEPVQVVVAASDIAPNTVLESLHLKPARVPERYLQPYSSRAPGEVLGMVTAAPIAAGEQILKNKIRRPQDIPATASLSMVVPKGKRAVTIVVDTLTGVGGFVRPGDIVDVVWTVALPFEQGSPAQPITITLFQDVPVLAVERQLSDQQMPEAAEGENGEGEAAAPSQTPVAAGREYTVTVALAPQEISFLLFAREQGRVQLSLRPKQETGSQMAINPVNIQAILAAMLGPQMQAPAKVDRQVEIYKGLVRDVVTISEPPPAEALPPQPPVPPSTGPVPPAGSPPEAAPPATPVDEAFDASADEELAMPEE